MDLSDSQDLQSSLMPSTNVWSEKPSIDSRFLSDGRSWLTLTAWMSSDRSMPRRQTQTKCVESARFKHQREVDRDLAQCVVYRQLSDCRHRTQEMGENLISCSSGNISSSASCEASRVMFFEQNFPQIGTERNSSRRRSSFG